MTLEIDLTEEPNYFTQEKPARVTDQMRAVAKAQIRKIMDKRHEERLAAKGLKMSLWQDPLPAGIKSVDSKLPPGLTLAFCPTGEGGGIDNSCGKGETGATTAGPRSRLNVDQASQLLKDVGYKLGKGTTNLKKGVTEYKVTTPDGTKVTMTAKEVQKLATEHTYVPIAHLETIMREPTTPPPPETGDVKLHDPDVTEDANNDGVTDSARVGVPAMEVPDEIPRLPNLTPQEREVEDEFASAYEANPEAMRDEFLAKVIADSEKSGRPPTFETDAAKEAYSKWRGDDMSKEEMLEFRSTMNTPLHGTANAMAKAAFVEYLDTLKPGDEILVTNGGCGAGKGHALGEKGIQEAKDLAARSKVVWDSAGDQNATENPWIQQLAEERGLKVNYLVVAADPYQRWSDPESGVVYRAEGKGRMVDLEVFVDSYVIGAENIHNFWEANKDNPNASFVFADGDSNKHPIKLVDDYPKKYRDIKRPDLRKEGLKTITKGKASPRIKRGALEGQRVWRKTKK